MRGFLINFNEKIGINEVKFLLNNLVKELEDFLNSRKLYIDCEVWQIIEAHSFSIYLTYKDSIDLQKVLSEFFLEFGNFQRCFELKKQFLGGSNYELINRYLAEKIVNKMNSQISKL